MRQAAVFGENLHLHRRIEAEVGTDEIRISDRVVNHGFSDTPHMLLYHLNVGYPLLDGGCALPGADPRRRDGVPRRGGLPAARASAIGRCRRRGTASPNRCGSTDLAADAAGCVPYAVVNDALGFGLAVEVVKAQLPLLHRVAAFRARWLRAGDRAGDQPRPGPRLRAGAGRTRDAEARRGAALRSHDARARRGRGRSARPSGGSGRWANSRRRTIRSRRGCSPSSGEAAPSGTCEILDDGGGSRNRIVLRA